MTVIPSLPSNFLLIISLGIFLVASGCNDREVPLTESGEPKPFDHLAALPGDHPPISAEARQGQRNAKPPARSQTAQHASSIKVSVKLSPALAGKTAPGDTVFIFARAAQGPKMPLAIVRKQVKDLPIIVTLDDSMAMVPDMKMSSFPQLVIGARISKSGNAISKAGDLEGYAPPMKSGSANPVEVLIASVAGGATPSMPATRPDDAARSTEFKHPTSVSKSHLNIPADVKAKWKTVELSLSGQNVPLRKVRVSIGGETSLDPSGLIVRVVAYVPAFQSDSGTVTSSTNNPDNPAVLVQLVEKAKVLNEGWVFQKYPDFNTYKNEKLQLQLLSASAAGG
jgi:hypothetical protein